MEYSCGKRESSTVHMLNIFQKLACHSKGRVVQRNGMVEESDDP